MWKTTRGMAYVIMPVLVAAWVILYWFPDRTKQLWAWTMKPSMTAITMGAGYMGGAWLFFRVTRNRESYRLVGVLVGAFVFTTLLGVATAIHWDKFNHVHVSFWAWLFLYTVSPVLLAVLAVQHRRAAAARPAPPDVEVPVAARAALAVVGAAQVSAAATWFVAPNLAMQIWPWKLTDLTARSLSAYVAFTGALLLWTLVDHRWGAVRIGVEAVTVGLTLTGLGALRAQGDFTGPTPALVGYAVGLLLVLALVIWLQVTLTPRVQRAATAAPGPSPAAT